MKVEKKLTEATEAQKELEEERNQKSKTIREREVIHIHCNVDI